MKCSKIIVEQSNKANGVSISFVAYTKNLAETFLKCVENFRPFY